MISTVILSKNNDETLEVCLKSVLESLPTDKEILVVDGHSSDRTPEILAKFNGKIKVVYDSGKGLGQARNVGVYYAKHDIIAFVDSDVICAKDHFQKILTYFEEHPDVGAVDTDGVHPQNGTKTQRNESLVFETLEKYSPPQLNLRGWCISFRRSAFDAVGGFWRGGSDDNDFSYRLRAKGIKMATVPTASWHMQRTALLAFLKEMKLWGKDAAYYYHKWGNSTVMLEECRKRKLFRLIPNVRAMTFAAYVSAPILGVKYFVRTRSLSFYVHFIIRQYAYLFGFIQGNFSIARQHVEA